MNLWGLTGLNVMSAKGETITERVILDYFKRLRQLALSIFVWEGLPELVSHRFLETVLFDMGRALFFKDPKLGFMITRCTPAGTLNAYMEPIRFQAYATNYTAMYDTKECVLIRNNYDMFPTFDTLMIFANRLANAERTMDVNIRQQKTPVLIICDDKQRMTMKNLYDQMQDNEIAIFADKGVDPETIKALRTDAPYIADKLMLYKHDVWNEALTYLGINNANTDKKERLITDEATANDQMISTSAMVMLIARQEAAEKINTMFGTSITVRMRETGVTDPEDPKEPEDKTDE